VVQEHSVQVNGMKIFYRQAGTGEPILLLHGNPEVAQLIESFYARRPWGT